MLPDAASVDPLILDDPGTQARRQARWHTVHRALVVSYFGVVAWGVVTRGVPTNRLHLTEIVVAGLIVVSLGRGWRRCAQVVLDWLPLTAVLLAYDHTRGLADTIGVRLHERDILHLERWVFNGEPTVWLQQHLYNPAHVYWYDAAMTLIYTSHFLATPLYAAVLWVRDRTAWLCYVARVITLSLAGLITYILFPEAPPWMAARDGLTAPVERLSARGWVFLHAANVKDLLEKGQSQGSNPVAAMPSLHFAFAVLFALFIGHRMRTRWRWLLALYPASMGFALVYLGEHWVLDLVGGLIYALAVHWALTRVEAWWRQRRRRRRADVTARVPEFLEELTPERA